MANSMLTINQITREAVRLWKNTNAFLQNIDTQYDDSFANTGAKIGTSLRIRLPNDYVVRSGPAAQIQDTVEPSTTLVVASQKGVDVAFSSVDRTMSLDDYSRRVLAPAVNNIAGAVAADVMNGVEGGICNFVANVDGSNNILTPIASSFLNAGALLDVNSAPVGSRKVINDPFTEARVLAGLAGLFNPSGAIGRQYTSGQMQQALGFDWMKDQTVIKHTTGTLALNAATVNGAGQTGQSIVVNALPGTLTAGDIITFPGVFAVNRITKQTTGQLRQFAVTANVPAGATQIPVYPALVPAVLGQPVQFQTVTASPANGAFVNQVSNANVTYRKSFVYCPEAVTMATADLEVPRGVHEAARESFDGISMRMVTAYSVGNDQFITRLDILYGYLWVRPEWACVVADIL
ncbi:Major capsid protein Gp5 [uncultured Caudovirales phage]|uniref:Major capsid protein Gp5 n=1 Tax=uncultured Caudovirales phage TaxID=2100421 RepID=A0A6J5SE19_9CAUD|nr:Major capsid protein Gp5 [uncultured Caudovirales phage]CAB4211974.1 Major capsid protein Gp5 [uncultured Caudovirales phage]